MGQVEEATCLVRKEGQIHGRSWSTGKKKDGMEAVRSFGQR